MKLVYSLLRVNLEYRRVITQCQSHLRIIFPTSIPSILPLCSFFFLGRFFRWSLAFIISLRLRGISCSSGLVGLSLILFLLKIVHNCRDKCVIEVKYKTCSFTNQLKSEISRSEKSLWALVSRSRLIFLASRVVCKTSHLCEIYLNPLEIRFNETSKNSEKFKNSTSDKRWPSTVSSIQTEFLSFSKFSNVWFNWISHRFKWICIELSFVY